MKNIFSTYFPSVQSPVDGLHGPLGRHAIDLVVAEDSNIEVEDVIIHYQSSMEHFVRGNRSTTNRVINNNNVTVSCISRFYNILPNFQPRLCGFFKEKLFCVLINLPFVGLTFSRSVMI